MIRTAIRPVSKKRARVNRERSKVLKAIVHGQPCAVRWDSSCTYWATDGHEPGMRSRGASITDPLAIVACCRACHGTIHANPAIATERGWMIPSWEAT